MREFEFDQIGTTPEAIRDALVTLRNDFDSHIHDGGSSRQFETLSVRSLVAGNAVMASNSLSVTKKNFTDDTAGFWVGLVAGVAKLYLGNTTNSIKWSGTALTIVGNLTATTGTIGGWTIGATSLTAGSGANTTGLDSGGSNPAFYAGSATPGSAPFRVTQAGALVASSATITGTITSTSGTIGGFTLGATTISGGSSMVLDSTGTGIITAGTIRTASSGTRIELTPTNEIKFYNGASFVGSIFSSSTTGIGFFDSSGVLNAAVLSTNGDVAISKSGGSFLAQSGGTFGWLTHNNSLASISSGNISLNANLQPTTDSTFTLGIEDKEWSVGYIDKIAGNSNQNVIDLGNTGEIRTNQNYVPSSAAGASLGDATLYWNDVSYKTLTDRGCLGWFDEGVELRDGTIVSDLEALMRIKKHPTKSTVYGKPMLDYTSLPKAVYKPADKKGVLIARDANNDPVEGQDGAETTALLSIMLGAIKELNQQLAAVKKQLPVV